MRQDDRVEVSDLDHEYGHAGFAAFGVGFAAFEVGSLSGVEGDALSVCARCPTGTGDDEEELAEAGGVFADDAAGAEVDAVDMGFAVSVSEEEGGSEVAFKLGDGFGSVRGEFDDSHWHSNYGRNI